MILFYQLTGYKDALNELVVLSSEVVILEHD